MTSGFVKQLPLTILALAITAVATVLGYYGHVTPGATLLTLLSVASVTGGLSLYTLASSTPNSALVAHLIVALGLAGAVTALAMHNIFGPTDVGTFLAPLIGTGVAAAPANALTTIPTTRPEVAPTDATLTAIADGVGQLLGNHPPQPPPTIPVTPSAL